MDPTLKGVISLAAAAVTAGAGAYAALQAKKLRDSVSIVDLYNHLVELPDPSNLTPEDVKVGRR